MTTVASKLADSAVSLKSQLLSNQLWETVGFVTKAAFMLGLTPWMLRSWGKVGYGEFAIASSAVVFLSLFDLGIRGRTRVALSRSVTFNDGGGNFILVEGLLAFGVICLLVLLATFAITLGHGWSRMLGIRPEHENLLLLTSALTLPTMAVTILLEAVVARGAIGQVKGATAMGWLLALPGVAVVLTLKGSVVAGLVTWLSSLLFANLCLLALHLRTVIDLLRSANGFSRTRLLRVLRESSSFGIAFLTWLTKSHGVTLLLSSLNGPVVAGTFFILLRISEVISSLGAISFDVALTAMPKCRSVLERRQCLLSTIRYALLFSMPCAAGAIVLAPTFFRLWLHIPAPFGWTTGLWVAGLGLATALNRLVTYVALGLGAGRTVALCGFAEMLVTVTGVCWLQPILGLDGSIGVIIFAVIACGPAMHEIYERLSVPAQSEITGARASQKKIRPRSQQPLVRLS